MNEITLQYTRHIRRQAFLVSGIAVLLIIGLYLALLIGPVKLNILSSDLWSDTLARKIFLSVRLPRVLAAILAGAALSVSGLAMQNVLRNPLASPFTLGISGSAAFGAALSIVLMGSRGRFNHFISSRPWFATLSTSFAAFSFALLSVTIILWIMKSRGGRPSIIILAGIMISSMFGACTSALQYFVNDRQLAEIVFWTFGDPGRATYYMLIVQSMIIIPVLFWTIRHSWDFALLQTGDESAKSGGLDPVRFRFLVLALVSLMTAIVVAGFGIIGYVGLVAPHICRSFIRGNSALIVASALFGGLFLLFSDALGRIILQPVILPVGIVTAFFGAPFFIVMLLQNKGLK